MIRCKKRWFEARINFGHPEYHAQIPKSSQIHRGTLYFHSDIPIPISHPQLPSPIPIPIPSTQSQAQAQSQSLDNISKSGDKTMFSQHPVSVSPDTSSLSLHN